MSVQLSREQFLNDKINQVRLWNCFTDMCKYDVFLQIILEIEDNDDSVTRHAIMEPMQVCSRVCGNDHLMIAM